MGLTQKGMARFMGVHERTYQHYEIGTMELPYVRGVALYYKFREWRRENDARY